MTLNNLKSNFNKPSSVFGSKPSSVLSSPTKTQETQEQSKTTYEDVYSDIEQQQSEISQRQRQLQRVSIPQRIGRREYASQSPSYRVQLSKSQKARKDYLKQLEEAKGDIKEQKQLIEKYEKEGYTLTKTPEGKYQFQKKVARKKTIRKAPQKTPDYTEKRKKYNAITKRISQLQKAKNNAKSSVIKNNLQYLIDNLKKEREKYITPSIAKTQITQYENVTKIVEKLSDITKEDSSILRKFKQTQNELEPTYRTVLVSKGLTPETYEIMGKITFPEYTSELTGTTYKSKTFKSSETPYEELIEEYKSRQESIESKEKTILREEFEKTDNVPDWFEENINLQSIIKQKTGSSVYSFQHLGLGEDYAKTIYSSWLYPEKEQEYYGVFNDKFQEAYKTQTQIDYYESGYVVPEVFKASMMTKNMTKEQRIDFKNEIERLKTLGITNPKDILIRSIYEESIGLTGKNPKIILSSGKEVQLSYDVEFKPKSKYYKPFQYGGTEFKGNVLIGYTYKHNIEGGESKTFNPIIVSNVFGIERIKVGSEKAMKTLYPEKQIEYAKTYLSFDGKPWSEKEKEGFKLEYSLEDEEVMVVPTGKYYVGIAKKSIKKEFKEDPFKGLVSWVSSALGPGVLTLENPLGARTLIQVLTGDKEGAIETEARIRAQTHIPEYRDIFYEEMHPLQKVASAFTSSTIQTAAWPVTLPQTAVKYFRGEGEWTNVMGRISTGKTYLPDVGMSLHMASPATAPGVISATLSDVMTGKPESWEKMYERPVEALFSTGGELLGFKLGSIAAQKFWSGTARMRLRPLVKETSSNTLLNIAGHRGAPTYPLNLKIPYGSVIRPAAIGSRMWHGMIEGVRYPSPAGIISRAPTVFEKTTKFVESSPRAFKYLYEPVQSVGRFGSRVLETPVFSRAMQLGIEGGKQAFPRSVFGFKPYYRGMQDVYGRIQTQIPSKFRIQGIQRLLNVAEAQLKEIRGYYNAGKISKVKLNELEQPLKTRITALKGQIKVLEQAKEILPKRGIGLFESFEYMKTQPQIQPVFHTFGEWATTPGKKIVAPMVRTVWVRGKRALMGKEETPQTLEFLEESIRKPGTYKSASMQEMTESDILGKGGVHGTRGMMKLYDFQIKLGKLMDKVYERIVQKPLSTIFKKSSKVDQADLFLLRTKYADDVALGGGKGIQAQSKLSWAKIKRFGLIRGPKIDADYIVLGSYNKTANIADDFARFYRKQTGKQYRVIGYDEGVVKVGGKNVKVQHEGTYTIVDSAGNRIRDFTSIDAPSSGVLRGQYNVPFITRTIDGVKVADLQWLVYNKVDIATMQGMASTKQIAKAILDIKVASGKHFPEMLVTSTLHPYEVLLHSRGIPQKLGEAIRFIGDKIPGVRQLTGRPGHKGTFITGYASRTTPKNPVQFQMYHQYPRGFASRWMLGLESDITGRESVIKYGWGEQPRLYVEPKPGMLTGKYLKELIKTGRKAKSYEEYRIVEAKIKNQIIKEAIKQGIPDTEIEAIRVPSYKFIQRTASKSLADAVSEAETVYLAGEVYRHIGWTPELGKQLSFKEAPTTKLGKAWERYGDWWAKRTGYKQYTIDIPSGREIPLIPERTTYVMPKVMSVDITPAGTRDRIGFFRTTEKTPRPGGFISSETATQPLMPKITGKHVMDDLSQFGTKVQNRLLKRFPEIDFTGKKPLTSAQIEDITRFVRHDVNMYYRPSFTYVERLPALYKPKEYERKGYEYPYEYEYPYKYNYDYDYKPKYTLVPYKYNYDYEYDYEYDYPYPYDYGYEYEYDRREYTPRPYPYPYKPPAYEKPVLLSLPPEEKKKVEKPKTRRTALGYQERKYEVPDIWKAGTKKPKFKSKSKPIKLFKPPTTQFKPKSKTAKTPKFFSLTGGM